MNAREERGLVIAALCKGVRHRSRHGVEEWSMRDAKGKIERKSLKAVGHKGEAIDLPVMTRDP